MKNKICQISCGRCCGDCEDLGPNGCTLPRDKRPPYCLSFICEISEAIDTGMINLNDAQKELRSRWGF